jgi:hypothetical protein
MTARAAPTLKMPAFPGSSDSSVIGAGRTDGPRTRLVKPVKALNDHGKWPLIWPQGVVIHRP